MTRVYENGKIINVEYDDYGNIKRLGNIELKYNLQNKISEYKKDNDVSVWYGKALVKRF